jgi:hypothetical protein
MRWEEEVREKCNALFEARNSLPRFDRTPEEEKRFNDLYLQAYALQWVLGIEKDWSI